MLDKLTGFPDDVMVDNRFNVDYMMCKDLGFGVIQLPFLCSQYKVQAKH